MKSTEEITMRFEAVKRGKDWIVIDTTTGELVAAFHSRRGLPASSLEIRARVRANDWNTDLDNFGQTQIGMTVYTKEQN
jgi:hypothetical protein